jgi:predicted nucleotidyltransferase
MFFEGKSSVQEALRKITERLNELGVPYAIVGGLALFRHGHRRFTEDVDILVTRKGLATIHHQLEGRGYLPPFPNSKHLRDTELGVKIEFIITGDFPGDGKPKPVAFPDPSEAAVVHEGISYLNLPKLIELKLASGMTNPDRMKDLADVLELIKLLALPRDFVQQLAPYVQDKFIELWTANRGVPRRYVRIWRNKFLTFEAKTIDDMIATLQVAAEELRAMRADGVELDPECGTADDYAYLVTTDPIIAKKYGMDEEDEGWEEEARLEEGTEP